ncbi:MAG: ankyrin repeat domain-containing protein [Rhodospirillaceae bacterium]|nr:ankyrin repeat domain-containing protein [Rhodospirillaceae bacterium]MDE0616011.1 ankyrin repeat domain-containing protein [Rhodospirillaceae bacterium]
MKALLVGGADFAARTEDNRTALSIAQKKGNARTASVLMAAGAKAHVSCEDLDGIGFAGDFREFWKRAGAADVRRCLAYRVKKYRKSGIQRYTLHVAAVYGRPEAVRALIDAGAKVDAKSDCQRCGRMHRDMGTALHSAVLAGKIGNVEALIAAGADITARDRYQRNLLEIATANGNAEITKILSDARKKLYERMGSVARDCANWMERNFWKYGTAADVKRCVRSGKKVDARSDKGWTRLHFAAAYGNVEMMKALIASGAKVDAREENAGTPLHIAAAAGTPGAVHVLLDAKTNAKAKSKNGLTPFDVAKKRNKRIQGTDAYWRLNEALHE